MPEGSKMNDLYVEMCRKSLIQKDESLHGMTMNRWFPLEELSEDKREGLKGSVWLPLQEDWQEIWLSKFRPEFSLIQTFNDFCHEAGYTSEGYCVLSKTHNLTELWCLFVHKDVFGLVWDWDKKKWVKG